MDSHIANIKKLYDQSDEGERIGIKKDIRALVNTLEGPLGGILGSFNTVRKYPWLHKSYDIESWQFLQVAIIRVGINLDLFSCLVNSTDALSADQIAAKTGAAPELLGMLFSSSFWRFCLDPQLKEIVRLLRHLASVSVVTQDSPTHFSSTSLCSIFATPAGQATIVHAFDNVFPSIFAFPSFLVANGHRNITDIRHTPFQQASGTSLPVFEYLALPGNEKQLEAFEIFQEFAQNSDWLAAPGLLDDAAKAAQNDYGAGATAEAPFFVDVGGGYGHQCVQLLNKYPWLEGRVVLEDTAEAIGKLKPIHGVKIAVQDFFQEQAVRGEFRRSASIDVVHNGA